MPKSDLLYLGHMLDTAHLILEKLQGKSREAFDEDDNLRLAVAHLLQMLGESSRRITEETKRAHPGIPWNLIVGMRHKIVHDYMDVDFDIVWETATGDLPGLVAQLEEIAPPSAPGADLPD
jgi:uncharacterized protein with HEPN domain